MWRGPLFYLRVRLAVARELREQHSVAFAESNSLSLQLDREAIDHAVVEAGAVEAVGAIGDGRILKTIIEFLTSDTGRALIKLLVALLLA